MGQAYNFVNSGAGAYTFEASNLFHYVTADNEIVEIRADQKATNLKVAGALSTERKVARSVTRSRAFGKRTNFSGCSADQESGLNDAVPAAESYAAGANSYISGLTDATDRYSTWFGAWDEDRANTVKDHFSKIDGNDFSTFTYVLTLLKYNHLLTYTILQLQLRVYR